MIDIVIVNWNSGKQLKNCLDSILGNKEIKIKVFVIDNASVDESYAFAEEYPGVTLAHANSNLGFGKACNLGAQLGSAEYILFLNPDAALYPDTLEISLDFMQNPINSKVGICGVQLVNEFGHVARSCARFPSEIGFLTHAIGMDRLFTRLGHRMEEWPHDSTKLVDQVIGAFFLVRRKLFESLNGFDERFFVYYEEVDFSIRARQSGWHSVYLSKTKAFHAGGGTSNKVKARRLFYYLRSRLLYATKHFSITGAILIFFITLLLEPFTRSVPALLRTSWTALSEIWEGYAMLWRWLPKWIFKGVTR